MQLADEYNEAYFSDAREIFIPADGDCLYTSIFIGFLIPVLHDQTAFNDRLNMLLGEYATEFEDFRNWLIQNYQNLDSLKNTSFKRTIGDFRKNMGVGNGKWGGPDEITQLALRLKISIVEMIHNPNQSDDKNRYVTLSNDTVEKNDDQQTIKIFLLRVKNSVEEAILPHDDAFIQLAKIESAGSSQNLQHYRLLSNQPEHVLEADDYDQPEYESFDVPQLNFLKSASILSGSLQGVHTLFNPPTITSSQIDPHANQYHSQAFELLSNLQNPNLLTGIKRLVSDMPSTTPTLTTREYQTMVGLMLLAGKISRPGYFNINTRESNDELFSIGEQFFSEFISSGAIDQWHVFLKKRVSDQEDEGPQQDAINEFIDGLFNLIKYIGKAPGYDFKDFPLNKYIPAVAFDQIDVIGSWLKRNRGHLQYDIAQKWFMKIDDRMQDARRRALKEGRDYVFSLLKQMNPTIPDDLTFDGMQKKSEVDWKTTQRTEFQRYVLAQYDRNDPYEETKLRSFFEHINRHQYVALWYELVCESFEERNVSSDFHQKVYQIWSIAHLDTFNKYPLEARSRMPNASLHGQKAPNFGYFMDNSVEHSQWRGNALARSCADIVVDAFQGVIDFGCQLDIDEFFNRLNLYLTTDHHTFNQTSHKDDHLHIPFIAYLLEYYFKQPFQSGDGRTVPKELLKIVAASRANLNTIVQSCLNNFKQFSQEIKKLRLGTLDAADATRFVFGIGFNGELFSAPENKNHPGNQVWIAFSNHGRTLGGYLALALIKDTVRTQGHELLMTTREQLAPGVGTFDKYKPLIRLHLSQEINNNYQLPDSHWDSGMLRYVIGERKKFEGYMGELETVKDYDQFSDEFKEWINQSCNWYFFPENVCVEIPCEMPEKEYQTQFLARNLLFDTLTRRSFSEEYASLMPLLFLHWKPRILQKFRTEKLNSDYEKLKNAQKLDSVPSELRDKILTIIDNLVWEVHPVLQEAWSLSDIDIRFIEFKEKLPKMLEQTDEHKQNKQAQDTLWRLQNKINGLKKSVEANNRKGNHEAAEKSDAELTETQRTFSETQNNTNDKEFQKAKALFETDWKINELPLRLHREFRQFFFQFQTKNELQGREVSQCVEPVFARVLGHDRFFSLFISNAHGTRSLHDESKKPLYLGNSFPLNVIEPCMTRCRYNALGHLYTGDALTGRHSADHLDQMRQSHRLGNVPDRLMTLGSFSTFFSSSQPQNLQGDQTAPDTEKHIGGNIEVQSLDQRRNELLMICQDNKNYNLIQNEQNNLFIIDVKTKNTVVQLAIKEDKVYFFQRVESGKNYHLLGDSTVLEELNKVRNIYHK